MAHTPGPWKTDPLGIHFKINGVGIYAPASVKTGEANARLISAAPELLEALKDANRALVAEGIEPSEASLNAIDKAEGR